MILGFAKFSERSRKLIKNIKKTTSKRQWKKRWKINQKPTQNRAKNHKKSIQKSMRFPSPPKNVFLAPSGRVRTPKSRRIQFFGPFLAPPWILRGPQNHPKSAKWRQKAPKIIPSLLLELSWNRPFSKIAPRTFLGIIFNGFGWIFNEFQHSFWSFFIIIPSSSGSAASAVRPLQ